MASAVPLIDSLIHEYLIYRGFVGSLKQFEADIRTDKNRKFRVDLITEHICALIANHDLKSLRSLWEHLNATAFAHLDQTQTTHVDQLENDIYKLYLSNCIQQSKHEKIAEFFELLTNRFFSADGWQEWFAISYVSNPHERQPFRPYFTKQWQEVFLVSLHNFLSLAFYQMPLPALLAYKDQQQRSESETNVSDALLRLQCTDLPSAVVDPIDVMDDFASIAQCQSSSFAPHSSSSSSSRSLRNVFRRKFTNSTKRTAPDSAD